MNSFSLNQVLNCHPLVVKPSTPLMETIALLNQSKINSCQLEQAQSEFTSLIPTHVSCALVMEEEELVGIFTEHDLVRLTAEGITLTEIAVGEAMTQPVTTFQSTEIQDLFDLVNLTSHHGIRHLPIVDEQNQLLGVITLEDVQRYLQPMEYLRFQRVAEVMSKTSIHTFSSVSVFRVAQLMLQHQVSYVILTEQFESQENCELETSVEHSNLRPVGIITKRDIIQFQTLELNLSKIRAETLMSRPLFLVRPEESLWSAHQQMQQHRVRRLIVAGEQGELKGIITQSSLLQALAPQELYGVIEVLQRQVCQLERERAEFFQSRSRELSEQVKQRTWELEQANQQLQQEINQRRQIEQQLVHDALHDRLTGLANRTLLFDRIEFALKHSQRHPNYLFALLFIDLDHFKQINDSLGHVMGDRLLIAVAKLLQESLRDNDLVARLGGDEFIILLDGIQKLQDATQISERIQELLTAPFELEGQTIFTSASIGIVLSSNNYEHSEDLLRDADLAMYRAKAKGKACYEVFEQAMYLETLQLMELEQNLRLALERGELILHYQPIVCLSSRELVGLEALIRWQHPQRGLLLPAEFLPLAEETGLSVSLGEWVLAEACRQLQIWQAQFASLPHLERLKISLNLSSQQLQQPQFIPKLDDILQATGVNGSCLRLEVTESVLAESVDTIQNILTQIKQRKIKLSIDDFGTGYSCLSYLSCFPLDSLKIDHSFIEGLHLDRDKWEIVRTIITLAQTLELETIAEGIETTEQLAQLKNLGAQFGQGYLLGEPLNAQEIESLLVLRGNN